MPVSQKSRWNCVVKDESDETHFWSVEAFNEDEVKQQITAKKWTLVQLNRVKEADELEQIVTHKDKLCGISAAVGIVAIVVSIVGPFPWSVLFILAGVSAGVMEVIMGSVVFGSIALATSLIRIYFLWVQFSQLLEKL